MKKTRSGLREPVAINATYVTWRNAASDGYLLLWGPENPESFPWKNALQGIGVHVGSNIQLVTATSKLVLPPGEDGRYRIEKVTGKAVSAGQAVELLGPLSLDSVNARQNGFRRRQYRPTASLVSWSIASKFVLELLSRQSFVPSVTSYSHDLYAVWQAVIESSFDQGRLKRLAASMPAAAHCLWATPHHSRWDRTRRRKRAPSVWHPEALLKSFIDTAIDEQLRFAAQRDPETINRLEQLYEMAPLPYAESGNAAYEYNADLDEIDDENSDDIEGEVSEFDEEEEYSSTPSREVNVSAGRGAEMPQDTANMKEFVYTTDRTLDEIHRWEFRWFRALTAPKEDSRMSYHTNDPRVVESFTKWLAPVRDADAAEAIVAKTGLWLEAPDPRDEQSIWFLKYYLVSSEDPTLSLSASQIFELPTERLRIAQHYFENPQEKLLADLGIAAGIFEPIRTSLNSAKPEGIFLDTKEAWKFISEASPSLLAQGFDVRLPEAITDQGDRRLRARLRIRDPFPNEFSSDKSTFGLQDLAAFQWEAALGDEAVSVEEFREIVALRQPLIQWHGSWVLVDPLQLKGIEDLIDHNQTHGAMSQFDAMSRALSGIADPNAPTANIEVVVEGKIHDLLEKLSQEEVRELTLPVPDTFVGELRPYQERGAAWLAYQEKLGLGCCLADDMGLGKTIQLIVMLLNHAKRCPDDKSGFLLVCPTSVVGNWQKELKKFAPSLNVVIHHGAERSTDIRDLVGKLEVPNTVVITTYGLVTRDVASLERHKWAILVLDEAQAIKNSSSKRTSAIKALSANMRVALTGTPIENRLAELWSILDFLNPGLLGSSARFQQLYAVPIERYNDKATVEKLKHLVSPFILRRIKSDPSIIQDLPEKMEHKIYCSLTREQATLYQALVESAMARIETATGISRHGHVLALLTRLKQVVDHPALYIKNSALTANRSGKIQRLIEMLETVIENGEKALIFTQFKEMGDILVEILGQALRLKSIPFLHGSLSQPQRDQLVHEFQTDPEKSVFVLSLKAGGTGLNLTAANHVFHFDRWWNPAVEDQATDRAFRIGQSKNVQVHKLLSNGTLEEKIDLILEEKKGLSDAIVDSTGAWVTQLDTEALRELFSLNSDAMIDDAD